jgi:small GTP-binding protein
MPKQKQNRQLGEQPKRELPPSVKLLRTLEGHKDVVLNLAFDPEGRTLASGSRDGTVKLWGVASGKLLRTLGGHKHYVWSVAFDSAGRTLASGSSDGTVKLWEVASGKLLRTLEWRGGYVCSVALDPEGRTLASGGTDKTVKLWEVVSGKLLRTLEGAKDYVWSVAFDPAGRTLASGSGDNTVKLWEVASGKLLRTLEGHTSSVDAVAFSVDGRLLASKGNDRTLRLWSCETWETVTVVPEPTPTGWIPGLAFHPTLPFLATVGSKPAAREKELSRLIHFWKLDLDVLLGQTAVPTVTYTSAKIVLVGESNVGKSYLAQRIATGLPPEEGTIKSTHGMKFWPLAPERLSPAAKAPEDQRRDVVLWDMGGQEEYRLIHQLFLHDTTVALVLIDPTRGTTAFKEAETWNKYLDKQLRDRAAVKLLVGAKLDQPSDTIDHQGLDRLIKECGFAGYYETSAIKGRGIADFCEAVAKAIDWDGLGKTSRPELFQRIRDEIEARRKRGDVVLALTDLERAVLGENGDRESGGREAVDAVTRQLATQGVIARSRVSTGEPVLVLQVQEIERYAGSLIIAARNNPRGVPALELRAIAQADFPLPGIADKERLPRIQEKSVLECTVQLMLEHGICFQHEGLLIFPTLFAPAPTTVDTALPHAVSLYYDFARTAASVACARWDAPAASRTWTFISRPPHRQISKSCSSTSWKNICDSMAWKSESMWP